jgi:predicted transposase YdaD
VVAWISSQRQEDCFLSNLREQASTDPVAAEVLPLIPAILVSLFRDLTLQEICTMGGITLEDLSRSRAYQEIFGLGEARGEARGESRGRIQELPTLTLRLLNRRCGTLSAATTARIEALLDFTGPADFDAWLATHD